MNARIGWLALAVIVAACGGGGGGSGSAGTDDTPGCAGSCVTPATRLTVADVQTVVAQAVFEAEALAVDATIAVVDRVGNVLAVFRMAPVAVPVLIATRTDASGNATIDGGLEGIEAPIDAPAAIAKAVTGAFLSSDRLCQLGSK
jgi:hypothetical protein